MAVCLHSGELNAVGSRWPSVDINEGSIPIRNLNPKQRPQSRNIRPTTHLVARRRDYLHLHETLIGHQMQLQLWAKL